MGQLRKLLKDRNITIELTDAAKNELVSAGYDPAYGARPLKRVLQQRIADPLSVEILEARVQAGDHVVVDAKDGNLTFTTVAPETAAPA